MKEIITIFRQNYSNIKQYIFNSIKEMTNGHLDKNELKLLFPVFKSLQSIYVVDSNHTQITPLYTKDAQDSKNVDKVIKSLKKHMEPDENGEYLSSAYISSKDGFLSITASKQLNDDEFVIMNFNLEKLLDELNYIKKAKFFNMMTVGIYGFIGYSLSLFSVILIFYAIYNFAVHFTEDDINIFQLIFKSTIALTLGLAIFDLAKNLLEHEVVYKNFSTESHGSKALLEKFLISIIIALSIESLMTVFKIALSDYKDIIYAVYLILAISVMILSLSLFNKYTTKNSKNSK